METVTSEELAEDLLNPFKDTLIKGGIDDDFLIRQLKREFRAKEPKIIKVKGAINPEDLPAGFKVIASTGVIEHRKEGDEDVSFYSDGETIVQYKVHLIGTSQKARMDAHKLRGDYPAEKHDISGALQVIPKLGEADRELLTNTANKVVDAILNEHRRDIKSGS